MNKSDRHRLAGGILAGGASRRMGAPKEGVRLGDGRPMIEHVIAAVRGALGEAAPVAIAGRCEGWAIPADAGFHHVLDRQPDKGPMGGLEALLASGLARHYLVCTCDQPRLTPDLLKMLAWAAESQREWPVALKTLDDTELDPFPCLLPERWLATVQEAMGRDQLSVRALLQESEPAWIMVPDEWAAQVRSFNSPEDLAELMRGE